MSKNMNLFRSSTVKLLEFISERPAERFYEKQISEKAGVSRGATNQGLRVLLGMGLVTRERQGRMFFYRYDASNPVGKQFRVLLNVIKLTPVVDSVREKAKEVIVFGSCAAGTDNGESDIDLFVLTDDVKWVRERVGAAGKDIERPISLQAMDHEGHLKLKREKSPFLERIRRGIVLWER